MEEGVVWRVGRKVALNVYEGDRPVCQCHNAHDALRIVAAVNAMHDPVYPQEAVVCEVCKQIIPVGHSIVCPHIKKPVPHG